MKQIITCIAFVLAVSILQAQDGGTTTSRWAVGLRAGISTTTISRYDAGRMDEAYSAMNGFTAGIQGRYAVNDWLAVRADLNFMQRSHRMDRNLNYLDPVYTVHINSYLMLPVLADFSFGGKSLRGHLLTGGYAGYWLFERRRGTTYWMTDYYVFFEDFDERREFTEEDMRFNAGVTFGAGLTYTVGDKWDVGVDALYYYDLTSHHVGYPALVDPRYLNTLTVTLGVSYHL